MSDVRLQSASSFYIILGMKYKSSIVLFLCTVVFGSFVVCESRADSKPFHATVAAAMEQANARLDRKSVV